jgi:predicted dehydrogenase
MIEGRETGTETTSLTYGMVGGGPGAFIGDIHRKAIAMDGKARLAAGCFSKDFNKTQTTGERLGLDKGRLYATYEDMFEFEKNREDKIDFVVIATPNNTHFSMARLAMECGIHVVCDKPLTTDSHDAQELARLAAEKDLLFCVTYAYTGYPIVKHIKELIAGGVLGEIRFINAEYSQDWLATLKEKEGQKQSLWRTDPLQAGVSNCVGDIGSHIENMVFYMTGLRIDTLCARLDMFGEGRTLDDNASILVDYDRGSKGLYWSSQIAVGFDNGFRVRIFGTQAGVDWCQESPNYMRISYPDRPTEIISRGRTNLFARAQSYSRIPSGHPEGYFEAFANIYTTFISALHKKISGEPLIADDLDWPDVHSGIRGVRFIEKCVESSRAGAAWVKF